MARRDLLGIVGNVDIHRQRRDETMGLRINQPKDQPKKPRADESVDGPTENVNCWVGDEPAVDAVCSRVVTFQTSTP